MTKSQTWKEKKFCDWYAETWEISTSEMHYAWLAPGENELGILSDCDIGSMRIMDVGCGMGENIIALSSAGADCYGLDISEHMLERAQINWNQNIGDAKKLKVSCEDMRHFKSFVGIKFDLIISIYSLEYLTSIREFRNVLAIFQNRLNEGGKLIFSFSHPLQHHLHELLGNQSGRVNPDDKKSPLIYSFQDVVGALSDTGFHVERIVELGTKNPSSIDYESSIKYPYHFHKGHNPCRPEFDEFSSKFPHTVVYRVTRPEKKKMAAETQAMLGMNYGRRRLWGEMRTVTDRLSILTSAQNFTVDVLSAKDSVVAVCDVLDFTITEDHLFEKEDAEIVYHRTGKEYKVNVPSFSLLGIIHYHLYDTDLNPFYDLSYMPEGMDISKGLFIERVDPLFARLTERFPKNRLGLLVFVNENEPGEGKVGLENFTPAAGDKIQIRYIVSEWGADWPRKKKTGQMNLF
jgi:ubiquinone/menaquinone biosynthesis C-methylase UbiE